MVCAVISKFMSTVHLGRRRAILNPSLDLNSNYGEIYALIHHFVIISKLLLILIHSVIGLIPSFSQFPLLSRFVFFSVLFLSSFLSLPSLFTTGSAYTMSCIILYAYNEKRTNMTIYRRNRGIRISMVNW